jgi:hypothetical protein
MEATGLLRKEQSATYQQCSAKLAGNYLADELAKVEREIGTLEMRRENLKLAIGYLGEVQDFLSTLAVSKGEK